MDEEDFDLMYEDELELLREQEVSSQPVTKVRKILDFSTQPSTSGTQTTLDTTSNNSNQVNTTHNSRPSSDPFETDSLPIEIEYAPNETMVELETAAAPNTRKRTIEELFGDIDDLLYDNMGRVKKKKGQLSDVELIEQLVEMRKVAKQRLHPCFQRSGSSHSFERDKRNLSYTVPKYLFVAVKRFDGQRIYVRCHTEVFEEEEMKSVAKEGSFRGVMGESFKAIWNEAQIYINKSIDMHDKENEPPDKNLEVECLNDLPEENVQLWVDKYKPHKYFELLSDESTNRILLKWMKLWDKVVFKRRPKITEFSKKNEQNNKFQMECNLKLDADGRPEFKVVLLCGPPGLGKTTLAHIVAQHAGYNVIEINASDERTTEKFETAIKNSTQMQSVLDKDNRPNCLIFDEIDGAPQASIDYLVKFITAAPKVKKGKTDKDKVTVLKRPIICICNNAYVPSLRPLRQIALWINFPQTSSIRLAERLQQIATYQQITTNITALKALCEKTGNDVRSCISALQFFRAKHKAVTLSEVMKANIAQKDIQTSLFDVWRTIFQIRRVKNQSGNNQTALCGGAPDTSLKSRAHHVLQAVHSFGDYDRLMQGVFENLSHVSSKDTTMEGKVEAMEWFTFNDLMDREIHATQNFGLSPYLQYGFVVWHFVFAGLNWLQLVYPSKVYEMKSKLTKNEAIISEVMKGMSPKARMYTNKTSLVVDILPFLTRIIVPYLRPVSSHFLNEEERKSIQNVACAMIDYGLTYVQERLQNGRYHFVVDPNVNEVVLFPGMTRTRLLNDNQKHTISLEIGIVKMNSLNLSSSKETAEPKTTEEKNNGKKESSTPSAIKPFVNKMQKTAVVRDIFGRVIERKSKTENSTGRKRDIWFKFKEGYSNAVRRPIKIKSLK